MQTEKKVSLQVSVTEAVAKKVRKIASDEHRPVSSQVGLWLEKAIASHEAESA